MFVHSRLWPTLCLSIVFSTGCISQVSEHGASARPAPLTPGSHPSTDVPALRGEAEFAQVFAAVLESQPELEVLRLTREARNAAARQAGLPSNPELGVEVEDVGGSGELSGTGAMETTVGVSQAFSLGGKLRKRGRAARLEAEMTGWERDLRILELFGEARIRFADVADAQEREALSMESVTLLERLLEVVGQRVESGDVSPVESTKARVELAAARIELHRAERELLASRVRLAALWGGDGTSVERVREEQAPLELPSLESLVEVLAKHPRAARWEAEGDLREARLRAAEAEAWPDLEIGAGVRHFNESDEHSFVLGVSVPLPIFNRNQGGVEEARTILSMLEVEREAEWRKWYGQLVALHAELQTQRALHEELRASLLPEAEEMYEAVRKAYGAGQKGMLDLLDAERTLLEARQAQLAAASERRQRQAALEALLGTTLNDLTVSIPDSQKESN